MAQIIEKGYVSRGWLGVEIQALNPALAESFGLEHDKGVLIAGVLRDGPADRAGLQPGDVLLELNDRPVLGIHDALNAIAQTAPGESLSMRGVRNRKLLELEVVVAERPQQR